MLDIQLDLTDVKIDLDAPVHELEYDVQYFPDDEATIIIGDATIKIDMDVCQWLAWQLAYQWLSYPPPNIDSELGAWHIKGVDDDPKAFWNWLDNVVEKKREEVHRKPMFSCLKPTWQRRLIEERGNKQLSILG